MASLKITCARLTLATLLALLCGPLGTGTASAADMSAAQAGAHASHTLDSGARAKLGCEECHAPVCSANPRSNIAFGALATAGGAAPSFDPATRTCSNVYCHGSSSSPVAWTYVYTPSAPALAVECAMCHGYPPSSPSHGAGSASCSGCHPGTVKPDGTIDIAGGKHVNGALDVSGGTGGSGCTSCHGFPPATGAHVAHFGLTGITAGSYADAGTLQDRYPTATPTEAPGVYAFGCALCHPTDSSRHLNGVVDVTLYETAGTGLKALAAPAASYDRGTGTCSGVYCHSTGQESPTFAVTPAWSSTVPLGCAGCHGNPPSYPTGGAGAANANSHLGQLQDGSEYGHFLGLPMPTVGIMKHGGWYGYGAQSAPITCQTCHFDTTDPASTAPGRFYWLDTTGTYSLGGGNGFWFDCKSCHADGSPIAPTGAGMVLPLRHVNGARDVVFDSRTTLPASMSPYLPAPPNTPTKPYWFTDSNGAVDHDRTIVSWVTTVPGANTGTIHFDLTAARYDPASKTCTNVGCHQAQGSTNYNPGGAGPVTPPLIPLTWGDPYLLYGGCSKCHPNY